MKTFNTYKKRPDRGVTVPNAALQFSGFGLHEAAEYHALSDAVVILKKEMSVLEIARAMCALSQLTAELQAMMYVQFSRNEGDRDDSVYDAMDQIVEVELPEKLREQMGLPEDASLFVNESYPAHPGDEDIVTEWKGDRAIPDHMLEAFIASGADLSLLRSCDMVGDVRRENM